MMGNLLYTLAVAAFEKVAFPPAAGAAGPDQVPGQGDVMGPSPHEDLDHMTQIPGQAGWPKPEDRLPPFQTRKEKRPLDLSFLRTRLRGG